jgi:hypothetical protein
MPAESRFLPSVGMTTKNAALSFPGSLSILATQTSLSFRSGEAARNLLFACSESDAGRKQIPPFGRNDNPECRIVIPWQPKHTGNPNVFVIPQRRSREESAVRMQQIRCRQKADSSLRSE